MKSLRFLFSAADEMSGFLFILIAFVLAGVSIRSIWQLDPDLCFFLGVLAVMIAMPSGVTAWEAAELLADKIKRPKFEWPIDSDTVKYLVPAALGAIAFVWLADSLFKPGDGAALQTAKALTVFTGSALAFYGPFKLLDRVWP